MGLIAFAVNPSSGRDIRRLVSHATVFNNREKTNIVERIILAATQLGDHKALIMPDTYYFGEQIKDHLENVLHAVPEGTISTAELPYLTESAEDTTQFVVLAKEMGADVIVVLGGDGTSRAACKYIGDTPLVSLSTGTNNVFPEMAEGTVVGMACAAVAGGIVTPEEACNRRKRIEVFKNGEMVDIALVDAVFSDFSYAGSKAIWERSDMNRVFVTQCHPASIGFSALVGSLLTVYPSDNYGAMADSVAGEPNCNVAVAAGLISPFRLENVQKVEVDRMYSWEMDKSGIMALDGEREVNWVAGDTIGLRLTWDGPMRVDLYKTLEAAQKNGFMKIGE